MWYCGIDIGTTHVKVAGVSADGAVLPVLRRRTPTRTVGDVVVHDATAVWDTVRDLVEEYSREAAAPYGPLAALSVASFGQEESVGLDADGRQVVASVAWWQTPEDEHLDPAVREMLDAYEHYTVTGMRLRPIQSPERISAARAIDPAGWSRVRRWVDFGAYVGWRLTGNWAAAANQLTHSQLFDLASLSPHTPSFDALQISPEIFAPVAHTGQPIGEILPRTLPGVALAPGARVVAGGHDQVIGAWAVRPDEATNVFDSIGTSEYLMVVGDHRVTDRVAYDLGIDQERAWDDTAHVLGLAIPTGKTVQLLAQLFFEGDFDRLMESLASEPPERSTLEIDVTAFSRAADGILSLTGIPADATGHTVAHAALDAVARTARDVLGRMCDLGGSDPRDVVLMGSLFARPQMKAHRERIWNLPLRVADLPEPVATGAAMLARSSERTTAGRS